MSLFSEFGCLIEFLELHTHGDHTKEGRPKKEEGKEKVEATF
jgi:hypothetical protein